MPKAKKLPSGRWRVRVYEGRDENGKSIIKSFTADTKKEAEYAAAVYTMQKKHHDRVGITLGEAFDKYIASKQNILSPATVRGYIYSKNALSRLTPLPIASVTNEIVQAEVNEQAQRIKPLSVRQIFRHLHAVLAVYAPDLHLALTFPRVEKEEKRLLTEEDVRQLLAASQGTDLRVPILLAAFGSLRRGEVAALRPSDVMDTGVHVRSTIVFDVDGNEIRKSPKTVDSHRFVPLPAWIVAEIRKWSFNVGLRQISVQFSDLANSLGMSGVTFHSLRHFFAAECHALGVPDHYIMTIGGWSSVATLQRIYQYAMPDKQITFEDRILSHFDAFRS